MIFAMLIACTELKSTAMSWMPIQYEAPAVTTKDTGLFELTKVFDSLPQITDVAIFSDNKTALITQKEGLLSWVNFETKEQMVIGDLDVRSASEQGLLSVAIHPQFQKNQKIYLHLTPSTGVDRTEIAEYAVDLQSKSIEKTRVLFETPQPYPNHNGGAIRFGSDGCLYVGLGDGGWRNDPEENGQNLLTPLGAILRFDVDGTSVIPSDNPYVNNSNAHNAIWISGLRNPWKFTMLEDGRIIVADVGQNSWEEVSIAGKGDNLGWNIWEGVACLVEGCSDKTEAGQRFVSPIHTYGRDEGQSITGGVILTGNHSWQGQYLFGDFMTGNMWVLKDWDTTPVVTSLGKLPMNISTFAADGAGQVYVADFGLGHLYRIDFQQ